MGEQCKNSFLDDVKQCRKIQKTLMRYWSNRLLAVRRVTVENQGKNV
ncbi:MAG: reverse transcriptase N-terminal domain-containing protein [Nostoc sp.]